MQLKTELNFETALYHLKQYSAKGHTAALIRRQEWEAGKAVIHYDNSQICIVDKYPMPNIFGTPESNYSKILHLHGIYGVSAKERAELNWDWVSLLNNSRISPQDLEALDWELWLGVHYQCSLYPDCFDSPACYKYKSI